MSRTETFIRNSLLSATLASLPTLLVKRAESLSAQNDRRAGEPPGGVSFSISYKELIATGLSGALLAFLASKWHVPGVLLGALSPMASVVIMAMVKAYSSSGTAPGRWKFPGLLYMIGSFWWFASLPAGVRRSILLDGLRAGLVSTVISASVVAITEVIVGEDLTCLVWQECQNEPPPNPEPTVPELTV